MQTGAQNLIHHFFRNRFLRKLADGPPRSDGFDDLILGSPLPSCALTFKRFRNLPLPLFFFERQ